MPANNTETERRLWDAADELRANSTLRPSEYYVPVLGLIFLKYADARFQEADNFLSGMTRGRRAFGPIDYQAHGALYLPEEARYSHLVTLPEGEDIGKAIDDAMGLVEAANPALKNVLPKTYTRIEKPILLTLLKNFNAIPMDVEGDVFGRIYEYFLGRFAMSEGQRGGEFFTPTSIVKLIVEVIEPYHGRILDPACGSGGMFVQSAYFVEQHQRRASNEISIYGQEKTGQTVRLAKMNLAVHGLEGDIREGNTYYEDSHTSLGAFDFVMANPPFNVNGVDYERLEGDPRFPFSLPSTDNANYVWIQTFFSALGDSGRAGFVMANSAADARHSEQEIRRQLIQTRSVDVMIAIGPNFFYTVTLPCMLWFLDRGKAATDRADRVLFIDARHIYNQIDRAHRDFTGEQLEFVANIVRLYRSEPVETWRGSAEWVCEVFPDGVYQDVPGLCKAATIDEIAAQGWSLNPGRYVGVTAREDDGFDFYERLAALRDQLEELNAEAHELEARISQNMRWLLENDGEGGSCG